jgi:hypothetical protein
MNKFRLTVADFCKELHFCNLSPTFTYQLDFPMTVPPDANRLDRHLCDVATGSFYEPSISSGGRGANFSKNART